MIEPHSVVSNTGLFRSGAMDNERELLLQVRHAPARYHFTCSIHPRMVVDDRVQ